MKCKSKVDLAKYRSCSEISGQLLSFRYLLWFFIGRFIISTNLFLPSKFKVFVLRCFGAKIGEGVVIKPNVNIKYPWNLVVGSHSWIGEGVWVDNLVPVTIGRSCSISQGAMLLTGSHNYKKSSFDLIVKSIVLNDGSWVGAKSVVCPGVVLGVDSVLSVGSIATRGLESGWVYQGNPAQKKRLRIIAD